MAGHPSLDAAKPEVGMLPPDNKTPVVKVLMTVLFQVDDTSIVNVSTMVLWLKLSGVLLASPKYMKKEETL